MTNRTATSRTLTHGHSSAADALSPFSRFARAHWKIGWQPIPCHGKRPDGSSDYSAPGNVCRAPGTTGASGKDLGWIGIGNWIEREAREGARWNIAWRLQRTVVGIDIDAYDGKDGARTLAKAENALGPLPPTFSITSRGADQPSRIRLFRIPRDANMQGFQRSLETRFGKHVDILHFGHRYAMAPGSISPKTGEEYRMYAPDGSLTEGELPKWSDLAELPADWLAFATGAALAPTEARADVPDYFGGVSEPGVTVADGSQERELFRYSCKLRGQGYDEDQITELVWLRMQKDCPASREPWTKKDAREKARSAMKYEPNARQHEIEAVSEAKSHSSWARVDLADMLATDYEPTMPTMLPVGGWVIGRDMLDTSVPAIHLLYPGLVHSIHGESESGKSWVALVECARLLQAGRPVLFIDAESDPRSVVERLRLLGCTNEQILKGFDYRHPESSPTQDLESWADMLDQQYDLAVIDGVTDSLGLFGKSLKDNDEVAAWMRAFPRQVAKRTGAAVVLIDHVTKSTDGRGRFAIGGQAKMAGLDGAAYTVDVTKGLGRGLCGRLKLSVAKDRPGQVRQFGAKFNKDRTQHVANFVFDATDPDAIKVGLFAPEGDDDERRQDWLNTEARAFIVRALEDHGTLSARGLDACLSDVPRGDRQGVTRDLIREALRYLVEDVKRVEASRGGRGGGLVYSLRSARKCAEVRDGALNT